jgi:hypothetical protein
VLILRHWRGLSMADAVRTVADYHDQEVRGFVAARNDLPRALLSLPAVAAVVADLGHWIRGNVDWSQESGRYAQPVGAQL